MSVERFITGHSEGVFHTIDKLQDENASIINGISLLRKIRLPWRIAIENQKQLVVVCE
jgi:hypothetical protein